MTEVIRTEIYTPSGDRFEARSRWSQAVLCPRQAAYGLRGQPLDEEPDDIVKGYFARGKQLGAYMAERFIAQYGAHDIVLEKAVPWPAGIAHGDIFVRSEKLAVEVKSKADPRPLDSHILQLGGQVHFDPEAESGALVLVDPSNLQERTIPMPVVPDALVEEIERISGEVAGAADPAAPLPARVCSRPSEARGHMCPFAATCFGEWEAPDPIELQGEVAKLALRLVELDATIKATADDVKDWESERDELRSQLRLTLEPKLDYVLDEEQLIRITPIAGRVTYDITTAIKMGALTEAEVADFRREGKGYERWTVRPVPAPGDDPVRPLPDLDYGDTPPF